MLKKVALAGAVLLVPFQAASAQDSNDLRIRAGVGGQIQPSYPGSDEHEWAPLFNFDTARGTNPFDFEAPDDNFSIALHKNNGFSVGPVGKIQSGRKNSDVGAPVGRVPTTIEVGGFVQMAATESIRLRAEVRKGIGGHDGIVASLGADQVWRDGDRYVFSIGPRVSLSDGRYQREWFGVTPEVALLTGLDTHRPDAGVHSVGAAAGVKAELSGPFGIFGYARYERLVGDAADSPIVREYGSRNQSSAGLGLTYTFTMRK